MLLLIRITCILYENPNTSRIQNYDILKMTFPAIFGILIYNSYSLKGFFLPENTKHRVEICHRFDFTVYLRYKKIVFAQSWTPCFWEDNVHKISILTFEYIEKWSHALQLTKHLGQIIWDCFFVNEILISMVPQKG